MSQPPEEEILGIGFQALADMPLPELTGLAEQLSLHVGPDAAREEVLDIIHRRLELIQQLDNEVLLDIVVWGHRPIRRSASKLELLREISRITLGSYNQLSDKGLYALAMLKDVPVDINMPAEHIATLLYRREGVSGWLRRKRRKVIGTLLHRLIEPDSDDEKYQFLQEQARPPTLKQQIEQQGVVSGLASKLRGAADSYVDTKLDEIELRIDNKLQEIDRRLAQWRNQEVANRLRIIKITLIASVIVAIVSLCYSYVKTSYLQLPDRTAAEQVQPNPYVQDHFGQDR